MRTSSAQPRSDSHTTTITTTDAHNITNPHNWPDDACPTITSLVAKPELNINNAPNTGNTDPTARGRQAHHTKPKANAKRTAAASLTKRAIPCSTATEVAESPNRRNAHAT